VTVEYGVRGGTATGGGVDYRLAGGRLVLSPGETRKSLAIEIARDPSGDQMDRTIEIGLSEPENAVLGGCVSHTYTIRANGGTHVESATGEPFPSVTFDRASQTVSESGCGVNARVVLSSIARRDVKIPFSIGGTATAQADYVSLTENPLVIRAGTQSAGIAFALKDNARSENDKTLNVSLGTPINAIPGVIMNQAITIKNDDRKRKIAVVPFYNLSQKKNAGEIMALHFVRHLNRFKELWITEPGAVREKLLDLRIIMDDGISLAVADSVFERLDADLILTGRVLDYEETEGLKGTPLVDFSVLVIERNSRSVIWHSRSRNKGDQGVFLFDLGLLKSTDELANPMVGAVVDEMLK
jgi:hypothetical protein